MSSSNHHEFYSAHEEVQGSSDRSFGFVIAGALTLLAAHNFWRSGSLWPFYLGLAAAFAAAAWLVPNRLSPLNRIWTKLGLLLSRIVNPIVMMGLFFLVFTPIGIFMRMRRRDLLHIRLDPAAPSYWTLRDHSHASSMKDQF